ncbi:MAG: flippase-like domain-containing protein [Bacteroidales bacterium]|nr:flippase-like domain-containing protein [Candidatus Physcousia equi]
MKKIVSNILKVGLPLTIAATILWWMYRGFDWTIITDALSGGMDWSWMLLSLPFGVTAQVFRGLRWKQALEPLGEHPRSKTCLNSIFLSYGSSLVVPRVGEFLRCAVLKRYDGVSFSRSMGTVVTERCIDIFIILMLSAATVLLEIPVFTRIANETGLSLSDKLSAFTTTGYLVTAACLLLIVVAGWWMSHKLHIFRRTRAVVKDLRDGLTSIRHIRRGWLFVLYSLGIWVSYFFHFYLTFYAFDYTQELGIEVALVAFVVGTFAVLVPTPNGAGPWHFAVKTVLVLYGVGQDDAVAYVFIVHTIQTALVALLGGYSCIALSLTKRNRT